MKHTEKTPFKSAHTGKELDPADTLEAIQKIIRNLEFNRDEKMVENDSDTLRVQLATFNTVLEALYFWYIHEGGDEHLSSDTHLAIQETWWDLKETINARCEEYDRVGRIALHGADDPWNNGPNHK